MKVAPSTSAVAGCELTELELVRQHGVFHRAEQGGDGAEQRERREQQRHRVQEEAGGGKGQAAKISANLSRRATMDLTYLSASWPPSPDRTKRGR